MKRYVLGCTIIPLAAYGGGSSGTPSAPDTIAPVIASASAADSAFASQTITVSVCAGDAVGVTGVRAVVATKDLQGQSGSAVGSITLAPTLSGGS